MRTVLALAAMTMALPATATPAREAKTSAAVLAADASWLQAEIRGDGDFLDQLLLPGYQSIGADGKATSKEAIVGKARARGPKPEMAAQVAKWKADHPTRGDVKIAGDTAVITWMLTSPGKGEPVSSCDVFVYVDGHWRGLYSQHSTASG